MLTDLPPEILVQIGVHLNGKEWETIRQSDEYDVERYKLQEKALKEACGMDMMDLLSNIEKTRKYVFDNVEKECYSSLDAIREIGFVGPFVLIRVENDVKKYMFERECINFDLKNVSEIIGGCIYGVIQDQINSGEKIVSLKLSDVKDYFDDKN